MNRARILIVEDEAVVACDLTDQLTELGYEPAGQAANGEDALAMAGQLQPDLVLMDIHFRGRIDGIAAAQAIRERFAIPVVFLSAFLEGNILDRAQAAQPFGYLTKPFQSNKLRMVIDLAIAKHQTEIRLRQAYEEQAAILRTTMDGFWMVDMHGKFLEVNDAYCRMSGYSTPEILAMRISELEANETADDTAAHSQKVMAQGMDRFETRHRHKDGSFFEVEVSVQYRPTEGGRLVAFLRDITERKRAEETLRESESRARAMLQTIPDLIFRLDRQGVFLDYKADHSDLYAQSDATIIGKRNRDITPPEFADLIDRQIRTALETGALQTFEYQLPIPGRGTRDYEARMVFSGAEEVTAIVRDVTERKRMEQSLLSESEFNRLIIENAAQGICVCRETPDYPHVRFTVWNECMTLISGYSMEEINRLGWYQSMYPDPAVQERAIARMRRMRMGDDIRGEEWEITRADGQKRQLLITTRLHVDGRSEPYVLGVMNDITDRKRAEKEKEKLENQNRQLQKAESLGRMAGAVAHHFNNQLQAVMMSLELAMNEMPRNAGPAAILTEAMKSARKAAEVSTLMLTYLGKTFGQREPLDLSEACLRNLSLLRAVMPPSVVLETDLATPGATVDANANQIQQVLTNLVTNAWEAIGDGQGAVCLSVKTVAAAAIPAANRFPSEFQPQDNAYACLEVADAGCGIADYVIEKIFDPFFSTKFIGRGMGLAVVLGIVRAHGGVITVESEPSRGSVFRVFLPVSVAEVPQKPVPVAQGPVLEGGGMSACDSHAGTLLLVEDQPMVRKMAALALTRLGFTVLEAADGLEAVEVFRQHQDEIRCVLCDLTMPRMNGWETLTALRKLVPGIPVILTSGYSEAQVMEGDHAELPQAFLSKPYEYKALINTISQVLANKKE